MSRGDGQTTFKPRNAWRVEKSRVTSWKFKSCNAQ